MTRRRREPNVALQVPEAATIGNDAIALVGLVLAVWFIILLPMEMANSRNRSAFGWVLVSVFFSPLLAILLLWLIGPANG